MSVPPKTDQDVPAPHRRTLPHFPVNEEGMRELEIWLQDKFGGKGFIRYVFRNVGKWLYIKTTGSASLTENAGLFLDLSAGQVTRTRGSQWSLYTDGGGALMDTAGGGLEVDTTSGNIFLSLGSGNFHVVSATGEIQFSAGAYHADFDDNSDVSINTAGQTYRFLDANGNPILTLTG